MFSMLIGLVLCFIFLFNQQHEVLIVAAGLFMIAGQIAMVVNRLDKIIKSKEKTDERAEDVSVQ